MARINEIDQRVLAALPGSEKIKTLLGEKGLSLKEFAGKSAEWPEMVSDCIRGARPLPEIREKLAAELSLPRAAIDELIDGAPAPAEEGVA